VVVTSPGSEFSVEVEEAAFTAVTAPDLGELLDGFGREEIVGIEIVREEKWLVAKAVRKLLFGFEISVSHRNPPIAAVRYLLFNNRMIQGPAGHFNSKLPVRVALRGDIAL
jgi:hypothetical protein